MVTAVVGLLPPPAPPRLSEPAMQSSHVVPASQELPLWQQVAPMRMHLSWHTVYPALHPVIEALLQVLLPRAQHPLSP